MSESEAGNLPPSLIKCHSAILAGSHIGGRFVELLLQAGHRLIQRQLAGEVLRQARVRGES